MPDNLDHEVALIYARLQKLRGKSPKDEAFAAAIRRLTAEARRPWLYRTIFRSSGNIDQKYIHQFAEFGSLRGVLDCCKTLGVDENQVRAIHALIYK